LREERKQSENSLGGYVQAVWLGAGPGPSQLGWDRWSGEVERSTAPSGGTGSSGRWSRWSLGPAVEDEGGLAVAWQYRPDGLCRQLRSFQGNLGTIDLSVPWHLRAIDQVVYIASFGIPEGTWGPWTCRFRGI
jgi:hypothetical protein